VSTASAGQAQLPTPDLRVDLAGVPLRHPVLNASGTFDVLAASASLDRDYLHDCPFSAYVPKTITLEPRSGNAPPRVTETPSGMINSIGLENPGLVEFARALPQLAELREPLIVSVGGSRTQDYAAVVRGLEERLDAGGALPQVAGYELNVSCPNVRSGIAIGSDPAEVARLLAAVRPLTRRVIIVKLTPNVTAVGPVALAAAGGGADVVSLVNTFKAMAIDPTTLTPFLGNRTGGLCGPAIKPIALRMVAEVAEAVELPIVGMGGIVAGLDVLEFVACGATAVAVGAATFADPRAPERIVDELSAEMLVRDIGSLAEVRGRALLHGSRPSAAPG